ncbi:MAG: hypothetical protein KF749_01380 [Bacteroidetes bacterium]|nr:hypothetical protein [Bacteroidota bacterium]MCW5896165.1 hypothetical protein [Bacteroidota bacterium]
MATRYEHTQIGMVMVGMLALGIFCATFWMIYLGFSWIGLIALVALDASLMLFSTLTVRIENRILLISFGPGVIRKAFDLNQVRECFVVLTPTHHGFGIRWMPESWLYNVPGTHAVDLTMKNGTHYRIGTDAPEDLAQAIQRVIHA